VSPEPIDPVPKEDDSSESDLEEPSEGPIPYEALNPEVAGMSRPKRHAAIPARYQEL
jgi:hypothetical protein